MRALEVPDEELVAEARAGSAPAFEALYIRHREVVARTVYLVTRDRDHAQDATHDAFEVAWRDVARLRDPRLFRAWVTGIALNVARRGRRRKEVPVAEVFVEESERDRDSGLAVLMALHRVARPFRDALVLRFFLDLSEAEIATALDVPVGTVKSRLSRGKRELARLLEVPHE